LNDAGIPRALRRNPERCHAVDDLAIDPQAFAAARNELHTGAVAKDVVRKRCDVCNDVLAIVEDDQHTACC
jgi:hypothetical protein